MNQYKFTIPLDKIESLAGEILNLLGDRSMIFLKGDLGAGKTTLVKSICRLQGINENICSPTFSIINEYQGINNNIVYHMDLYRINDIDELVDDIGIEEYFNSGDLCLIEWPEIARALIDPDAIISIQSDNEDTRSYTIQLF